ncbi:MAG: hypothetical protein J0M12_07770 [Deltaproteobacteria bacterium]|nr:hypothetical protein [Deltaproteobacteria bacterium]
MSGDSSHKLREILTALVLPLARFCVRRTLTIQDFEECAKQAFLTAAREECETKGDKVSLSRLSAITGLHRRDVSRIQVNHETKDPAQNVPLRVVGLWLTDKRYLTKAGVPRQLSYGNEASDFSRLVARVSKNIHAGSVLAELERLEIVRRRGEFLKLRRRGFEPRGDAVQILTYLAQDSQDLFAAVEGNLASPSAPPCLHATTEYDQIPATEQQKIQKWILQQGALFHQRIRKFLAKHDREYKRGGASEKAVRVSVGTFGVVSDSVKAKDKQ